MIIFEQKENKTEIVILFSEHTHSLACNNNIIISPQKPLCLIPTVWQPCGLLTHWPPAQLSSLPAYGTVSEGPLRVSWSLSPSLSLHGF